MPDEVHTLGMYLHLARASSMRLQPGVRDKLLVLAGVKAEEMDLEPIAALCRHRILSNNPRHLVRQWPTLAAALADDDFQSYLRQLRRRYSDEKVEHMLHALGIELAREPQAYFSDLEYAASLLEIEPESIAEVVAQPPSDRTASRQPQVDYLAAKPVQSAPSAPAAGLAGVALVWGPWLGGLVLLAVVLLVARLDLL